MATVQFQNGQSVNFQGTPTPQDIDFVAQKLGVTPSASQPPLQESGQSPLSQVSDTVGNIFPGKILGQDIGTLGGYGLTAAKEAVGLAPKGATKNYNLDAPSPVKALGDAIDSIVFGMGDELPGIRNLTPLVKGAIQGGAFGTGGTLAKGDTNINDIRNNAILGSIAGGTINKVGQGLSSWGESLRNSILDPAIKNQLAKGPYSDIAKYIEAESKRASNIEESPAYGIMTDQVEKANDLLQEARDKAGKEKGDIIKQIGKTVSLAPGSIDNIINTFKENIDNTFGHYIGEIQSPSEQFSLDNTTRPGLIQSSGRARELSSTLQDRIMGIYNQLEHLSTKPTVTIASDIQHNLDDLINYDKVDKIGVDRDPLNGIIRYTRGTINGAMRQISPELAQANDKFSHIAETEKFLGTEAGKTLKSSGLFMRRLFAGDMSARVQKVMDDMKGITGIDLKKEASMAKYAVDNFGNSSSKTFMKQYTEPIKRMGSARQMLGDFVSIAEHPFVPNARKLAQAVTEGRDYQAGPIGDALDKAMKSPAVNKLTNDVAGKLHDMGVNSTVLSQAATQFVKNWLAYKISSNAPQQTNSP